MQTEFRDRRDAGRQLAGKLDRYKDRPDVIVLGLPRGGIPVAYEVAACLNAPLDLFVVRKLGLPGYEELAMGAIASGGVCVINPHIMDVLGVDRRLLNEVVAREKRELQRREQLYRRGESRLPDVRGKVSFLIDDGIATASTMYAAIRALRVLSPARIVVAVPVAPPSSLAELGTQADEVIALLAPTDFIAVGQYYEDFSQTTDEEVKELLEIAARRLVKPREESGDSRHVSW